MIALPRELRTERLVLRAATSADRDELERQLLGSYAAPSDDDPMSPERAARIARSLAHSWDGGGPGAYLIALADGPIIGNGGLRRLDDPREADAIQIGYSLVPAFRGRGYMREAATALVHAALTAGYAAVHGFCAPTNDRSAAVMLAIGMTEVPTDGDRHFIIPAPPSMSP